MIKLLKNWIINANWDFESTENFTAFSQTLCDSHNQNPQIKTIFFLLKCTDENLNLMLCKCQTKTNAIEIT